MERSFFQDVSGVQARADFEKAIIIELRLQNLQEFFPAAETKAKN